MRNPGIILLLPLMLALSLDSGISQSIQSKECLNCNVKKDEMPGLVKFLINKNLQSYKKCAGTVILFVVNETVLCGQNSLIWVQTLMECLDKGNCKELISSNPNKEFSKGSSINPSTTTQNPTTTPHVTTLKTTTTEKIPDIVTTREMIETTTPTKSPTHHDGKNNMRQGEESSKADKTYEDNDNKMSHMKTAIISLILIILVMVAVGTGVFCYKKKASCREKSISYIQAPSQDTLEMVTTVED